MHAQYYTNICNAQVYNSYVPGPPPAALPDSEHRLALQALWSPPFMHLWDNGCEVAKGLAASSESVIPLYLLWLLSSSSFISWCFFILLNFIVTQRLPSLTWIFGKILLSLWNDYYYFFFFLIVSSLFSPCSDFLCFIHLFLNVRLSLSFRLNYLACFSSMFFLLFSLFWFCFCLEF